MLHPVLLVHAHLSPYLVSQACDRTGLVSS